MADVKKIQSDIIEKSEEMAKVIAKGKDVELRKSPAGLAVIEVNKKVISK